MLRLACSRCGGTVSAVAPLAELTIAERLCPRCSAPLQYDRRTTDRRVWVRRQSVISVRRDRRTAERRTIQRRSPGDRFRFNPLVDGRTRWQTVQRPLGEDG
jgi:hypothetical protein